MRLKNKKTGEIVEVESLYLTQTQELYLNYINGENKQKVYITDKIASFNLDWEDYEGPKEYWTIDWACTGVTTNKYSGDDIDDFNKSIGNYFETREEAEESVRKLRAWKRLKDKGFRFTGINDDEDSQELITQCGILCEADIYHLEKDADFLLLFGGEDGN